MRRRHLLIICIGLSFSNFLGAQEEIRDKLQMLENKERFESLVIGRYYVGETVYGDSSYIGLFFSKKKLQYDCKNKYYNYSIVTRYRIVYGESNMFRIDEMRRGRVFSRLYGYFDPDSESNFYLLYAKPIGDSFPDCFKNHGVLCVPK